MSYNSKKENNSDFGSGIFSALIEAFAEFINLLLELFTLLMGHLVKWVVRELSRRMSGTYHSNPVEQKHLHSKKTVTAPDYLGFSASNKRKFHLEELNTKKHTAVIGSTGSGKTVCLRVLIDHALRMGKPVIYFDPKASLEAVAVFRKMCLANRKKLYLFTDIAEDAMPFNPLLDGTLDDISDRIINALEWSEPFYKNESIQALDDVLQCLAESRTIITFKNILLELEKHSNKKNIKGLINQLGKVSRSPYGTLLNNESRDVLTFNRLRLKDACIYVGISSMGHSSSGQILNKIFFGGLLTHAKDSLIGKVPGLHNPEARPTSIIFDELSSTIHEGFIDLQNKCRQAGMEITYATQGPSDIDRISPILTAQIFENTNNLFVFNQIVPAHTEFFARTFGTVTSDKKTHVMEDNRKGDAGSVREAEEFMVHGNILRNLRVGQCVLLQRSPKRVDLLNIRNWELGGKFEHVADKQADGAQAIF
ncbi:MAG: hypothetical protein A2X86_09230 [Bdellovibrionales bacterium GWA2_49_15]|nr:MAG: hypothetical protein A2X86_09230 [Bdellovibrionales bacterium GWA2_49_15]HAZ12960.1 hypothetical protein [Bdellovibrionales bacterium]